MGDIKFCMWIDTLLLIVCKIFVLRHTISRLSLSFRCQRNNIKELRSSRDFAERSPSMRNYDLQWLGFFIGMYHSRARSTSQKWVHCTFLLRFLPIKMENSLCRWVVDTQFLCCLKKQLTKKDEFIFELQVKEVEKFEK